MGRNLLLAVFLSLFFSQTWAEGFFAKYRDPVTGMLDGDKMTNDTEYKGPALTPYVDDRDVVQSIHAEGDNKMVYTMKDGSKRVFERDPFMFNSDGTVKKDRPWTRTR